MGLRVQYPLPLLTPETVLLPASTTFTEVKTGRERTRSDMKEKLGPSALVVTKSVMSLNAAVSP